MCVCVYVCKNTIFWRRYCCSWDPPYRGPIFPVWEIGLSKLCGIGRLDPGPLNDEDWRWSDALKKFIRADIQDLVSEFGYMYARALNSHLRAALNNTTITYNYLKINYWCTGTQTSCQTCAETHSLALTHDYTHAHWHSHALTHLDTHTHSHTHIHTHTQHTRSLTLTLTTHTHTHTHTNKSLPTQTIQCGDNHTKFLLGPTFCKCTTHTNSARAQYER